MDLTSLVIFLLIGAAAGWLAGMLMRGGGFGILGNIVVGILGAVVGGLLFGLLGLSAGGSLVGSLITAIAGAAVLLFIVGLIKKAGRRRQGGRASAWFSSRSAARARAPGGPIHHKPWS